MMRLANIQTLILTLLFSSGSGLAPAQEAENSTDSEVELDPFQIKAEKIKKELDETYGEGFWDYIVDGVMPRPYLVAAEHKDNVDLDTIATEYADILGNLYREFYEEYRELLDLDPITKPVVVLIYDSKDSYKKIREARPDLDLPNEEFMGGYYMPSNGRMTQWRSNNLWEVMFHEGTHQLVDYSTKKWNVPQAAESPWFQEGFADFMGGHKTQLAYSEEEQKFVRSFELRQFIDHRYSAVQTAYLTEDNLSLKELTHLTFWKFKSAQNDQEGNGKNQRLTGLVYSQGWALSMFLHYFDNGRYRPDFEKYMQAEIRGEGGGKKFGEIFYLEEDLDWDDFEEEFRDFIFKDLRRMKRKK